MQNTSKPKTSRKNQPDPKLLKKAREVLALESQAVAALQERLDKGFLKAVEIILGCAGRIVVTGMGKSGHIGRKLAATLTSTGTPSIFLHPAEGVHGDLGIVAEGDVLIALSYGGDTDELTAILPAIKRLGVPIIALCGRCESELGRRAEVLLDISVEKEACPLNMAPTASTTAMLAMGDALAVVLMEARRFTLEDYQKLHPAGRLGRQMLLSVEELMRTGDSVAVVDAATPIQEVLFAITSAHAGLANITDAKGKLLGILADGDIRRYLMTHPEGLKNPAQGAMVKNPKTAGPNQLATEALLVMEKYQIGEMPVLDPKGRLLGVLNLKDLLRAGIV
jgi:arabinose-5-phosphate isomerase